MSVVNNPSTATPTPERRSYDLAWPLRLLVILLSVGMVWSACSTFVLTLCVNQPHAWESMGAFAFAAVFLMVFRWFSSLVIIKRVLFAAELMCLVGVGIVAGLLSWAHWG